MTTKKMTYQEVRAVNDQVMTLTNGSNARAHYTLGALDSMLSHMVADLPKHKQQEYVRSMEFLVNRLKDFT